MCDGFGDMDVGDAGGLDVDSGVGPGDAPPGLDGASPIDASGFDNASVDPGAGAGAGAPLGDGGSVGNFPQSDSSAATDYMTQATWSNTVLPQSAPMPNVAALPIGGP